MVHLCELLTQNLCVFSNWWYYWSLYVMLVILFFSFFPWTVALTFLHFLVVHQTVATYFWDRVMLVQQEQVGFEVWWTSQYLIMMSLNLPLSNIQMVDKLLTPSSPWSHKGWSWAHSDAITPKVKGYQLHTLLKECSIDNLGGHQWHCMAHLWFSCLLNIHEL